MVLKVQTDKHEVAFNRYRRIVNLKWSAEKTFLELGKELYAFQEGQQWRELEYRSFSAFLGDPDVNIAERTAFRLIRVWKQFVLALNVQQEKLIAIGGSKLDMIAGHVSEENIDTLLNSAATLSRSDLRAYLTGVEPNYKNFDWREGLREARSLCYELMQFDSTPDEVKSFAADFWSATGGRG